MQEVAVEIELDDDPMPPGVVRELTVRLHVPDGQHLYGEPVPEGMVATTVELEEQPGLLILDSIAPPTTPHTLATGETLQIYEGDVTLRVRFTHTGDASLLEADGTGTMPITGRVRWQCCDDEQCGLPASEAFEVAVPLTRILRTRFGNAKEGEMDSLPYLVKMSERRS